MPERIQLSRKKGWRKPENTVVVSRPSKWGNPYRVVPEKIDGEQRFIVWGRWADHNFGVFRTARRARAEAVDLFELNTGPRGVYEYDRETLALLQTELAGKNLGCWCPLNHPCHADVLLELANTPNGTR